MNNQHASEEGRVIDDLLVNFAYAQEIHKTIAKVLQSNSSHMQKMNQLLNSIINTTQETSQMMENVQTNSTPIDKNLPEITSNTILNNHSTPSSRNINQSSQF